MGCWGGNPTKALENAIVDSGASENYVTDAVTLENISPGTGKVLVANGRSEEISQQGRVGPLEKCKKIRSFTRSLISVRSLSDQFGGVYFDSGNVYVVTASGVSKPVVTSIGRSNEARLYSFDIEALEDHAARCAG